MIPSVTSKQKDTENRLQMKLCRGDYVKNELELIYFSMIFFCSVVRCPSLSSLPRSCNTHALWTHICNYDLRVTNARTFNVPIYTDILYTPSIDHILSTHRLQANRWLFIDTDESNWNHFIVYKMRVDICRDVYVEEMVIWSLMRDNPIHTQRLHTRAVVRTMEESV